MATVDRDHSYRARDHFRAVQATQCGAFGYLVKPVGKEELLDRCRGRRRPQPFALTEG